MKNKTKSKKLVWVIDSEVKYFAKRVSTKTAKKMGLAHSPTKKAAWKKASAAMAASDSYA